MFKVYMVLFKYIRIDINKYLFNCSGKFITNKVAEGGKGWSLLLDKKVHISDVSLAKLFNLAKRTESMLHKSEQYYFEQLFCITSWAPCFVAFQIYKIF